MATLRRLSTSVFVLGVLIGCSTKDTRVEAKGKANPGGTHDVQLKEVAFADRTQLVEDMERELSGIERETKRLSASIDASRGEPNPEARTRLDDLRKKWTEAKKNLAEAEDADESTWDDVQDRFRTAHGDLKDSFEDTRQWMSDKLEPGSGTSEGSREEAPRR